MLYTYTDNVKTIMIRDQVYRKLARIKGKRSFSKLLDSLVDERNGARLAAFEKLRGILTDREARALRQQFIALCGSRLPRKDQGVLHQEKQPEGRHQKGSLLPDRKSGSEQRIHKKEFGSVAKAQLLYVLYPDYLKPGVPAYDAIIDIPC